MAEVKSVTLPETTGPCPGIAHLYCTKLPVDPVFVKFTQAPAQIFPVGDWVKEAFAGLGPLVIVTDLVPVHPLASVAVTVYVPTAKFVAVWPTCELLQL
jgi:hypothetical protein